MPHLLVHHRVADFDAWKPQYDAHQSKRTEAGLTDLHLWTRQEDTNEVFILFGVEDVERATEFAKSEDLRKTMEAAGVVGPPDISVLNEQ